MKKFIYVLMFLSLTCIAGEPKFHFKDCVKVTNGFYRGCKGTVEDSNGVEGGRTYGVSIESCKGEGFWANFNEDELEASTNCPK